MTGTSRTSTASSAGRAGCGGHTFVNDLKRSAGTYLTAAACRDNGLLETDDDDDPGRPDYGEIWRRPTRSSTPARWRRCPASERGSSGARPRGHQTPEGQPASDITIGGAELAGQAIAQGLVDECHLLLNPVIVGGGKRALPDGVRADLALVDERRFASGVVYLRYRL